MRGCGNNALLLIVALMLVCAGPAVAQDKPADAPTLDTQYPGLATSALTFARPATLPPGVLLKAGDLTILEKEITDQIAQAPQPQRDQWRKNAFYLLENMAGTRLLAREARAHLPAVDPNVKEQDLIQQYLAGVVAAVTASEEEAADFYEANKDPRTAVTFEQVKDEVKQAVLLQKRQDAVNDHVRALGRRTPIEVSDSWAKAQVALVKDNPVDKARAGGKPTLVNFDSSGSQPADIRALITERLKTKYAGKVNVLSVDVNQDSILAGRYGVRTIPTQFLYDKNGKEVFRHTGFWPQTDIEKKLAELGMK